MKEICQSKKWGISFLISFISLSAVVCLVVYFMDPFFQFRVRDNQYFMNPTYVDAGLLKNYNYDTVIIGSCMVENYNVETFNKALGVNAVKIGSGGLGPGGVLKYTQLANKVGKAKKYYLNVDFWSFEEAGDDEPFAPCLQRDMDMDDYEYLLKTDFLSKLQYMFSYEAWFRFLPVDIGLTGYRMVKGDVSGKLAERTSIAHNGEWSDDYVYGEDVVMKSRENDEELNPIDNEDKDELLQTMTKNMDLYVDSIDFSTGDYTFIFPPYSYLFWDDVKLENKYEVYIAAKNHMIDIIKQHGGVVYDFQNIEQIYDLNNYWDTNHYSKYINDYMIECMSTGEYKR